MNIPAMVRIKQHFDTHSIEDIPAAVRSEISKIALKETITPGNSVAITAGSRGIANIKTILAEVVGELKRIGAEPFIVPAMGSHGGATGEGQRKIIEHYGITEAAMNAPIKSSMEVVQIGTTADGVPVLLDRNAYQADHIVVVNRVKPHTDFKAEIESGLIKMMAIGLGKQKAADHYHNVFMRLGHYRVLVAVAPQLLSALLLWKIKEMKPKLSRPSPRIRSRRPSVNCSSRPRVICPVSLLIRSTFLL